MEHTLAPVFNRRSRVLILGSIPSPKSRAVGCYYGNPQNRFWQAIAAVLGVPIPVTTEQRRTLCLESGIALWDVLQSCDIAGASDQSIRNPVANDLSWLLSQTAIRAIFTTGQAAHRLYRIHCQPKTGLDAICLPSSSPANCRVPLDELVQHYRILLPYLADNSPPDSEPFETNRPKENL